MRNGRYPRIALLIHVFACFVALVAFSRAAIADEASDYQKVLERWSQKLPDLEKTDTGETAKDIALIKSWIGQAQAYVASESFERIDPIIERMNTLVVSVTVKQERARLETAVKKADATLNELTQSITQTKAEADRMLEQVRQLDGKK